MAERQIMMKNCESVGTELVECARQGGLPDGPLKSHLAECDSCCGRWDAERRLTGHLRALRIASVPPSFEWSKAVLMRDFDAHQKRERHLRWVRGMSWGLSTAAVLVLSLVGFRQVYSTGARTRPAGVAVSSAARAESAREYVLPDYTPESFAPAVDAGEQGFIAVPFTTPLAPGEILRIVRTELHPATLVSMGVSVEQGWNGALPADLLVWQDGLPRAVRVANDVSNEDLSSENEF